MTHSLYQSVQYIICSNFGVLHFVTAKYFLH